MVQSTDVYESASDESVSTAVIRALAAATGKDPMDMDIQLYDAIDPDALDALYELPDDVGPAPRISFTLAEYHVTIDESCDVLVTAEPNHAHSTEAPARPGPNPFAGPGITGRIVSDN